MAFVQIMSYTTSQRAEMDAALQQWLEDTRDVRRARRRLLLKDRSEAHRYVEVVFFDSYEDAMHNSNLPATGALSRSFDSLSDGGCHFENFDVVDDDDSEQGS
jgi:hypothetical protein